MKYSDLDDYRKSFFRMGVYAGFFLLCAFITLHLAGCGSSAGNESSASDVLGLTSDRLNGTPVEIKILPGATKVAPGDSIAVTVKVTDKNGLPANDVTVSLSSLLGGTFDSQSGETKNGYFSTQYKAPEVTGTDGVTAIALGTSSTALVLISAKPEIPVEVKLSLGSTTLKPKGQTTVSVNVRQNNNPVNEMNVVLSSTAGGEFANNSGTTQKGWFNTVYTAPDNVGTGTIFAAALDGTDSEEITISQDFLTRPEVSLYSSAMELPPGGVTTLTIKAQSSGKAVTGKVILTSTIGGTFESIGDGELVNGYYSTTFTSPTDSKGLATITALVNGASCSIQLFVRNPPANNASVSVIISSKELFPGQATLIIVRIFDKNGSPVSGKVAFDSSLAGTFTDPEKELDNGSVYTTFTAGEETGSCTINAYWQDASGSASLKITERIATIKVSTPKDIVKKESVSPISVQVTDLLGAPFESEAVTVTTGDPDAKFNPATGQTDKQGFFVTEFTAGNTVVDVDILFTSRGVTASKTIKVQ
ncbi:MAG: Ig-like domain-containing protein [Candidatus Riflebacteria bacterium]|nr:Ig-like domain-containing protein [Candidatus Riflebacteria bacterium]